MMIFKFLAAGLSLLFLSSLGFADTLILKDGRTFQGKFLKGDKNTIAIEAEGKIMGFPLSSVSSISFEERAPEKTQPADPAAAAERSVPVKSEIQRGALAAAEVMQKAGTNLDKAFLGIGAMINEHGQRKTDTEAFYLGAYCQTWVSFNGALKALNKNQPRNSSLVKSGERTAANYFQAFRKRQAAMGVDDETLFELIGIKYPAIKADIEEWTRKKR